MGRNLSEKVIAKQTETLSNNPKLKRQIYNERKVCPYLITRNNRSARKDFRNLNPMFELISVLNANVRVIRSTASSLRQKKKVILHVILVTDEVEILRL